jgi:hypothetical protein
VGLAAGQHLMHFVSWVDSFFRAGVVGYFFSEISIVDALVGAQWSVTVPSHRPHLVASGKEAALA